MKATIEIAERLVRKIYPTVTYESVCSPLARSRAAMCHCCITHGMFRATIIPDNYDFVIKTGRSDIGYKQCCHEALAYQRACESGVSEYFARYIGSFQYHNHIFYVFEKIYDISDSNPEIEEYEDELPDSLWRFLNENNIDDIHNENYGFRDDGSIAICDYAGYKMWR